MSQIILYQPYYHFPGHFKSQFKAFRKNLSELGYSCLGIVGLLHNDEIEKSEDTYSFHYHTRNRFLRIFTNLIGFSRIRQLLQHEKITTIHFLDIEIFLLSLFVRFNKQRFLNVRIIITQHSINRLQNQTGSIIAPIYRWIIRNSYSYLEKNFDLIVLTNGLSITKRIVNEGILSSESLETIWWGSDYATKEIDWDAKIPNSFLFYGIIRKDKNLELLFDTFSQLDYPFHLHIAGYPRDYSPEYLQKLLYDYGLTDDKVTLELEYLSEKRISQLLKSSTFILLPYNRHNLSNSGPLIDSMQFGCIPIASGYGERHEFISHFNTGYLFYYDHSPSLKDILIECHNNPDKNVHYQETLQKVKNRFTWKWIIRDLSIKKQIYK